MKLIVTGHDFSGKSTFLKTLYNELNDEKMSFIHLSYKEPTDYTFYDQILNFSNFIMDRSFLDELIYAPVFGRTKFLNDDEVFNLINKTDELGIKIFIFECSDNEIKNRILKRDHIQEEPEVLENISYIKEQYRKLAEKYGIKIIDTTDKTYKELRKLVMED